MKKFTSILFSFLALSAFAQTQVDKPTDVAFGENVISTTSWDVTSSNITIDGTLTFNSDVNQYALKVANKTITIGSTGVLNMNSTASNNHISLGAFSAAATITIKAGGKLNGDRITASAKDSVINVYSPDGFNPVKSSYSQIFFYQNATLNMYGAGTYSYTIIGAADKIATLGFAKDVDLNIMDYVNVNSFTMDLVDFTETNSIFFTSKVVKTECILTLSELSAEKYAVSFYDGENLKKTITITGADLSNFSFEQATVDGVNGYLLSAVAVPEPAEWTMIFGGIALALAVYRRRK